MDDDGESKRNLIKTIINKLFPPKRPEKDVAGELMRAMMVHRNHVTLNTEPKDEQLLRFFRGEQLEECRHTVSSISEFTENEMEVYHDFIQWIFPTTMASNYHPDAPIISEDFAAKLCADDCAMKGYCTCCNTYLHYMGLRCDTHSHIEEIPDALPFWKLPGHNYFRITRMLDSQRQTGHADCSRNVYEAMMSVLAREPKHWVSRTTLDYWRSTQQSGKMDQEGI